MIVTFVLRISIIQNVTRKFSQSNGKAGRIIMNTGYKRLGRIVLILLLPFIKLLSFL